MPICVSFWWVNNPWILCKVKVLYIWHIGHLNLANRLIPTTQNKLWCGTLIQWFLDVLWKKPDFHQNGKLIYKALSISNRLVDLGSLFANSDFYKNNWCRFWWFFADDKPKIAMRIWAIPYVLYRTFVHYFVFLFLRKVLKYHIITGSWTGY